MASTTPASFPSASHPGIELARKLKAAAMSPSAFAQALGLGGKRVKKLIKGTKDLSPGIALRIGRFFGEDPESWMLKQVRWDLALARKSTKASALTAIQPLALRGDSPVKRKKRTATKTKTKTAPRTDATSKKVKAPKPKSSIAKQQIAHVSAPAPTAEAVENPSP